MESETQVFWNKREVLETALPLMLRAAHAQGLDVDNPESELCLDALRESISLHKQREPSDEPAPRGDVETRAVFDLLLNPYIDEHFKDSVLGILDKANPYHCFEVFRVAWPIALAKLAEEEGSDEQ